MRVLGAIVQILKRSMLVPAWPGVVPLSLSVTMRFGGHPCFFINRIRRRLAALVLPAMDDLVENMTVLIDRAPQPGVPSANSHGHFIQMPNIAGAWKRRS